MDVFDSSRRACWSSRERLDDLLQEVGAGLQSLPGVRTLSYFGSMAEGRADGYSDLDVIVTTDDLPTARERLFDALAAVGRVESCWAMYLRPDEWNPTILFADEGYYHKLDLGVVASDAIDRTIPSEQTVSLGVQTGDLTLGTSAVSNPYAPPEGSVGHFLLGQFIGGSRYCKARMRGRPLSCYRFVSAAADWLMRVLYAHLVGDGVLAQGKLSTEEYARLERVDVGGSGGVILAALDYSTPERMDRSLCLILREMHRLCQEIASARNERLDDGVFQRMLPFMCSELSVAC